MIISGEISVLELFEQKLMDAMYMGTGCAFYRLSQGMIFHSSNIFLMWVVHVLTLLRNIKCTSAKALMNVSACVLWRWLKFKSHETNSAVMKISKTLC